jgi:hypothetical protein
VAKAETVATTALPFGIYLDPEGVIKVQIAD